jgi:hypothetical protein
MRSRPHISALASEAFTLFSLNKTAKWLDGLDAETRKTVITDARAATPGMYRKFKERQEAMEKERQLHFEQQKEEVQRREERKTAELVQVNSMIRQTLNGE